MSLSSSEISRQTKIIFLNIWMKMLFITIMVRIKTASYRRNFHNQELEIVSKIWGVFFFFRTQMVYWRRMWIMKETEGKCLNAVPKKWKHCLWSHKQYTLTMDQGAIQPLDVVVLRKGEQDLIADYWKGQKQNSPGWNRQREGAQEQPGREERHRHPERGRDSGETTKTSTPEIGEKDTGTTWTRCAWEMGTHVWPPKLQQASSETPICAEAPGPKEQALMETFTRDRLQRVNCHLIPRLNLSIYFTIAFN